MRWINFRRIAISLAFAIVAAVLLVSINEASYKRSTKALEAMTAAELWTRMGTEVVGLMSALGRMDQVYLGVVAEGDDIRHVTQRTKLKDAGDLSSGVTVVTFKRDGTSWKVLPRGMNQAAPGEGDK